MLDQLGIKRRVLFEKLDRAVCGSVVDDHNLDIDAVDFLFADALQNPENGRFLVVGGNKNRQFNHFGH